MPAKQDKICNDSRFYILKFTNDYEIHVFMKHEMKYESFLFPTWGDFVNNGFIKLLRLWVLSETDVTPPLPGNQTIDEY